MSHSAIIFGYKFDNEDDLFDTIKNTLINTDDLQVMKALEEFAKEYDLEPEKNDRKQIITKMEEDAVLFETFLEGEGSVVGYLGMGEFYIGEIYYLDFDSDLSEEDMLELIHEGKRVLRLNNIDESKFRIYYDEFF